MLGLDGSFTLAFLVQVRLDLSQQSILSLHRLLCLGVKLVRYLESLVQLLAGCPQYFETLLGRQSKALYLLETVLKLANQVAHLVSKLAAFCHLLNLFDDIIQGQMLFIG